MASTVTEPLNSVRGPPFLSFFQVFSFFGIQEKHRKTILLYPPPWRLLRSWDGKDGTVLLFATALVSLGSAVVDGLTDGLISAESTEASAVELQSLCQTGHSIGQATAQCATFRTTKIRHCQGKTFFSKGLKIVKPCCLIMFKNIMTNPKWHVHDGLPQLNRNL